MWHLIYATKNLTSKEKIVLNKVLDSMSFSCGADLQVADLPDALVRILYVKKCIAMSRLKSYIMQQILMISVYTVLQTLKNFNHNAMIAVISRRY